MNLSTPMATPEHTAEFQFSLSRLPLLRDHGLQGLSVLPGSFFLEKAANLHVELFRTVATQIRNVTFLSPIVLTPVDTCIQAKVTNRGSYIQYRFFEAANSLQKPASPPREVANLEIPCTPSLSGEDGGSFSIESFLSHSQQLCTAAQFYAGLSRNGNQYGPAFQKVDSLWKAADELLGRISAGEPWIKPVERRWRDPILLDAVTQLFSVFTRERGRAFVLRSIEEISFWEAPVTGPCWCHAQLNASASTGDRSASGTIRVFNSSGALAAKLRGITISLLDGVEASREEPLNLALAANFTCEPVEETIAFWAHHFGASVRLQFAPYNQLFQQLLDPASTLHKNSSGTNVLLLSLEEWLGRDDLKARLTARRGEKHFAELKTCILPNGIEIAHLNGYETDYLYKEIFADETYLRNGVFLPPGAVVLDVGANIGLFSLWVTGRCENATILAFEPAPEAYEVLKANCEAYGRNIVVRNIGLSDRVGSAPFVFYPNSSVFSGFHPDAIEDRAAIETAVRNAMSLRSGLELPEEYVREISSERLKEATYQCGVTTISEVIREHHLEKIDLLKIDAEKCEWEILSGILEEDWSRIRQIVIEVHDRSGKQVLQIQDMLKKHGYHCRHEEEDSLKGSGLSNVYATRSAFAAAPANSGKSSIDMGGTLSHLEETVHDFCSALQSFAHRSAAPLLLLLCPRTSALNSRDPSQQVLQECERKLAAMPATVANLTVITSPELLRCYATENVGDAHAYAAGHIPYTREGYAAIGTAIFRYLFKVNRSRAKVIVLDCDNTLWKGACGEGGPASVTISDSHLILQAFMLEQLRAGMLLCLCSKNNEADALGVFDQRSDMRLSREHLAAWRINWESKSDNIRALASELNLSLDTFIFLDDDPVECAEVRINCPAVLTLQLPSDPQRFPLFLHNIWALDRGSATTEDQNRTRLYRENAQRERARSEFVSLRSFIESLQLRIEIVEAKPEEWERVSQLTFRTNQFNFTTLRRSRAEIGKFLDDRQAKCLAVRVSDKFGDYGMVGVVMYVLEADHCQVDTFLLSCRVLGRGVEHAVVRSLSEQAQRQGKEFVQFDFKRTEKNRPAWDFLNSLHLTPAKDADSWVLPAHQGLEVEYADDNREKLGGLLSLGTSESVGSRSLSQTFSVQSGKALQEIAESLYDCRQIVLAIDRNRGSVNTSFDRTGTMQSRLGDIWRRVLGRTAIGLNENFFEVGGTSIKAVQLVATIKRELDCTLSIASVFEYPTLARMAERLDGEKDAGEAAGALVAIRRGQHRRYTTAKTGR